MTFYRVFCWCTWLSPSLLESGFGFSGRFLLCRENLHPPLFCERRTFLWIALYGRFSSPQCTRSSCLRTNTRNIYCDWVQKDTKVGLSFFRSCAPSYKQGKPRHILCIPPGGSLLKRKGTRNTSITGLFVALAHSLLQKMQSFDLDKSLLTLSLHGLPPSLAVLGGDISVLISVGSGMNVTFGRHCTKSYYLLLLWKHTGRFIFRTLLDMENIHLLSPFSRLGPYYPAYWWLYSDMQSHVDHVSKHIKSSGIDLFMLCHLIIRTNKTILKLNHWKLFISYCNISIGNHKQDNKLHFIFHSQRNPTTNKNPIANKSR